MALKNKGDAKYMEKTKQSKLKGVITSIRNAESGDRLPKKQFKSLLHERVRLCRELVDRLFEINRAINFAAKNEDYRLPYNEYKALCKERQEIREALEMAKWKIYDYSK